MDQFLDFWSAHNITIIEGLIALVLVLAAITSYRLIFSQDGDSADAGGVANSAELEKTLQKILEGQKGAPAGTAGAASSGDAEDLKLQLRARDNELEDLRNQLASAQAQVPPIPAEGEAPVAGASAVGGAAASITNEERSNLENKIHDLEARLAEYEIISEDIADLSRYKEENAKLNEELSRLGGAASAASTPAPAAAAPAPEAPAAVVTAPVPEPAPTPAAAVASAPAAAEPVATVVAAPATTVEAPATTITGAEPAPDAAAASAPPANDENLMKEFTAAIEGQKPDALPGETDKLMTEFENFVKKG